MIATMALLCARAGLSHDAFVDYYENHHVPLVLRVAPPPARWTRTYLPVAGERPYPADFDVVTHLQFADTGSHADWLARVRAEGSGVAQDEERFLDRARTRSWTVTTRGDGWDSPRGPDGSGTHG